ncbi:Homeobox protein abdominal-A [Portunus trituberculatus]|uniref:Homeobox protein abdominal-A n=1 Tax=Portunus trituberculatus TaxID=210409 RepID=A0A5B7CSD6_PORTR|nr:Homeobox protein abdominal-A [Portunus trituberculatus]
MFFQVKIWFQNRRMKLKKELRAVKEINEQVRREREEQDKLKQQQDDKKANKEQQPSTANGQPASATNGTSSSSAGGRAAADTAAAYVSKYPHFSATRTNDMHAQPTTFTSTPSAEAPPPDPDPQPRPHSGGLSEETLFTLLQHHFNA